MGVWDDAENKGGLCLPGRCPFCLAVPVDPVRAAGLVWSADDCVKLGIRGLVVIFTRIHNQGRLARYKLLAKQKNGATASAVNFTAPRTMRCLTLAAQGASTEEAIAPWRIVCVRSHGRWKVQTRATEPMGDWIRVAHDARRTRGCLRLCRLSQRRGLPIG